MQIPTELIEQIQKGNVVLFCGAGISRGPGGLPSGPGGAQLTQELAERAGVGDVSGMGPPEVAQDYELKLGYQSLIQYVINRIDDPKYSPLRTHQLIAALPFNKVITTNWDNLIGGGPEPGSPARRQGGPGSRHRLRRRREGAAHQAARLH